MNTVHWRNNLYKNGEYHPDHSEAMAVEKAKDRKLPTLSQVKYRDALYRFCIQKGLIRDGFRLGRTNRDISSNIRTFITILKKNGCIEEFFNGKSDEM